MCIITVCTERKLSEDELNNCWQNNPDGAGMAWVNQDSHVVEKGFMHLNQFKARYAMINTFPHIVHFRIATAGAVIPQLTHPFLCKKMSPLKTHWKGTEPVLFHNGVVYNWEKLAETCGIVPLKSEWSDSRILAHLVHMWQDLKFLKEDTGKYAVLIDKEIQIFGNFIEEKGIQFSNYTYESIWYTNAYTRANNLWRKTWYEYKDDYTVGSANRYNSGNYQSGYQGYSQEPSKQKPCEDCIVVNPKFCQTSNCKSRFLIGSRYLDSLYQPQQNPCGNCYGSYEVCEDCPKKFLVGSRAVRTKPKPDPCGNCTVESQTVCCYCHKSSLEGSRAFKYTDHSDVVEYNEQIDDFELVDNELPFSRCDGRCEKCEDYNPKENTCGEVIKVTQEHEQNIQRLENSISEFRDRVGGECIEIDPKTGCPKNGTTCSECFYFDKTAMECTIW